MFDFKPIRWIFEGDKLEAQKLMGKAKNQLFQLKNIQNAGSSQFMLNRHFRDGSSIFVNTSVPGMDIIRIYAPAKAIEEEKRKVKECGLVLQFDWDYYDGPYYPGIFVKLDDVKVKNYKWLSYLEDPGNRTMGNTYQGAMVESKGKYAYGFGQHDFVFQIDVAKGQIVNQVELKSNTSTLINACLDDVNNNVYVIMARDGYGDPGSGREIFRVSTRDSNNQPSLQVQAHVSITDKIQQLAVNTEGNRLYAVLGDGTPSNGKVIVYDGTTLSEIERFPAYGTVWPYPEAFADKDGNIITIQRYAAYDYKMAKYSPSGGNLGQVTLLGYPIVCSYDGVKYAYVGLENSVYANPNEVHKIDVETMSRESSVSIPRVQGDSPHVLSIDVDEGKVYLVGQFSTLWEIKTSDLSYKEIADKDWDRFLLDVNPSNKAFYFREQL